MLYSEVKKVLVSRQGREQFQKMFPQLGSAYDLIICLFKDIDKAMKMKGNLLIEIKDRMYQDLMSLLRSTKDVILYHPIDQKDRLIIDALVELIGNWIKLVKQEKYRDNLGVEIRDVKMFNSVYHSLNDLLFMSRTIIGKVRNILMNEPYVSKISEMYKHYLEDYFKWREDLDLIGSYDSDSKRYEENILGGEKDAVESEGDKKDNK